MSESSQSSEELEEDNIRWDGIQLGMELMKETYGIDHDLVQYLKILKNRPEMRMLLDVSKDTTKEQIEAIVRFIEGMIR